MATINRIVNRDFRRPMKHSLIQSAVTLGLVAGLCHGDDLSAGKIKQLEEQMAALQREKAALAAQVASAPAELPAGPSKLFESDGRINPAISNAVLIIAGDQSVGTGFTVSTDGKKYLYTAAHVFSGNNKLTIKNAAGVTFRKFGVLEAAEGADLIRMEILEEVPDFLEIAPQDAAVRINTPIAALGNGGGTGVVAVEKGKILGTSADSLEVSAGIIQGNSGGPVVDSASGRVLGLVTHLTNERKDIWAEGTRQGEVRRFACRVDRSWTWKPMKVGSFLADAKALAEFDELTRIGFAIAQLQPLTTGLRLNQNVSEGVTAIEILDRNRENELVRTLIKMNNDLGARKSNLSEAELRKKFTSLIGQILSQEKRSSEAFKPQNFAWFHRNISKVSVEARAECIKALTEDLDNLR